MIQHVTVFDLETLPCTNTVAHLNYRDLLTDDEAAEILGRGGNFPLSHSLKL